MEIVPHWCIVRIIGINRLTYKIRSSKTAVLSSYEKDGFIMKFNKPGNTYMEYESTNYPDHSKATLLFFNSDGILMEEKAITQKINC